MVFFFFQAEDGIRDLTVTGVQTCALPIFDSLFLGWASVVTFQFGSGERLASTGFPSAVARSGAMVWVLRKWTVFVISDRSLERSEERRVGKECRSRWSLYL